jgi:transposase
MGKALCLSVREDLIRLYKSGVSLVDISRQLSVGYSTTRMICKRYNKQGSLGLQTNYKNCGLRGSRTDRHILDACITLRSRRQWGARRILVELNSMFPDRKLPSERSINELLRREKNDRTA